MYSHIELTKRERQVLAILVDTGESSKEIAEEFGVSLATIETHLHRIYSKLEVSNRVQAVIYVYRNDLLVEIQESLDEK